jgi:RNA polymerase sigma-70 factor (ECF subfamily)
MLLEQCKRQDQEALRVLFRRHEKPVYNLLLRMLSNRDDAEEALAEVFVKVWRAAASFKGESKFTTWLYRIAANTARDYLRSRMTRQEVSIEDVVVNELEVSGTTGQKAPDPETSAINAEDRARIVEAMRQLTEEDRLLISLYHFQELDYEEIAQVTGGKYFRATDTESLKTIYSEIDQLERRRTGERAFTDNVWASKLALLIGLALLVGETLLTNTRYLRIP